MQGLVAATAAFFPACADYVSPSALLSGIISGLTAGIFAACVMLLHEQVTVRGFDPAENYDCALAALTAGLVFMTLGRLDYPPCNTGRLLAAYYLMRCTQQRGAAQGARHRCGGGIRAVRFRVRRGGGIRGGVPCRGRKLRAVPLREDHPGGRGAVHGLRADPRRRS